jgi:monoamine oxidase
MDLVDAELHPAQKDAIRALHYDASSKVQNRMVDYQMWHYSGGRSNYRSSTAHLRLPSYNIHDDPTKPAILLASYTWAQDAQRIGSLIRPDSRTGEDALKELILRDLAKLHAKSDILRIPPRPIYHPPCV